MGADSALYLCELQCKKFQAMKSTAGVGIIYTQCERESARNVVLPPQMHALH